jgi:hypothetical protein
MVGPRFGRRPALFAALIALAICVAPRPASAAATSPGELYAFGLNNYGQLGSEANSGANPTPALVTLPGASGPVTQIAGGGYHSLALTSSGQLYTFGYNRYGQLGSSANNGTSNANPTPALVTPPPGANGPVTQIAAGEYFSLALTSSGQLYAFGLNNFGQLGNVTNTGTPNPNPTPTLVSLPGASDPVVQIAAGNRHSLALTSSGQLYAFGWNHYGQLGIATNAETETPNPTPTLVSLPAGTTIETMARGPAAQHTLVVIADLAVTNESLPAGRVGTPYSATATAEGGSAPYSWQASGLPAGLSIDPASGQIGGAPGAAGTSQVTLTVTDRFGITAASPPLALSVIEPAPKVVVEPAPKVKIHYTPNTPHKPNPNRKGGARWTFRFSSNLRGAIFQCRMDKGAFKRCSSPKVYRNLKRGRHVFRVKARNREGIESAVRRVKFYARKRR